jgi:hypothetical protein
MAHITSSAALQTNLLAGGSHTIAPGSYTLPATALTLQVAGSLVATGPGVFISAGNSISSWTNNGDGSWSGTNTTTGMVWGYRDPTINDVFEVARSPKRNGTDLIDRTTNFYVAQDQSPSLRSLTAFDSTWATNLVLPANTSVPQAGQWIRFVSGAVSSQLTDARGGRVTKITAKNATTSYLTLQDVCDDGFGPTARGSCAHIIYLNDLSFLTAAGEFHHNETTGAVRIRPFGSSAFSTTKTVWAASRRTTPIILESAWTFTDVTFCDHAPDPRGPSRADHFFDVKTAGTNFDRCSFINVSAPIYAAAAVTVQGGTMHKVYDAAAITLATGADASVVFGVTFYRPQFYSNFERGVVDIRAPRCQVRACDFRYVSRRCIEVAGATVENGTVIEYNIFDEVGATAASAALGMNRAATTAYAAPQTRPSFENNYVRNVYGARQFVTITGGSPSTTLYSPYGSFGVYVGNGAAAHWTIDNNIFENVSWQPLRIESGANVRFQHNLVSGITTSHHVNQPWVTTAPGADVGGNYGRLAYNTAFTSNPASQIIFRWNALHSTPQPPFYAEETSAGQTITQNVTQHTSLTANDISADPQIVRNQDGWIIGVASTSLLKTTSGIGWSDPPVAQMGPGGWGFVGRVVNRSTTVTVPGAGQGLRFNPDTDPNIRLNSSFTTRTISLSQGNQSSPPIIDITLNSGEHTKIVLPSNGILYARLRINGVAGNGQRVHIIGGHIAAPSFATTGLTLRAIDCVYLEGLRVDKRHFIGDCVVTASLNGGRAGRLYIQNCLFTGPNYGDADIGDAPSGGAHGDALQLQTQTRALHMDKVTMYGWEQCFLTNSSFADDFFTGPAIVETSTWSRVNFHCYRSRYNPKKALMGPSGTANLTGFGRTLGSVICQFADNDAYPPNVFDLSDVWVWDDQTVTESYSWDYGTGSATSPSGVQTISDSRRRVGDLARPSPLVGNNEASIEGTVSGDSYTGRLTLHPSMTAGADGSSYVSGGIPPGGDFVNGGNLQYGAVSTGPTHSGAFTGLGYVPGPYGSGTSTTVTTSYFVSAAVISRASPQAGGVKNTAATNPRTFSVTVQALARSAANVSFRATDTTFMNAAAVAVSDASLFYLPDPPTDGTVTPPPSPAQQPELLTWDPDIVCRLTNPTTVNVPTTGYPHTTHPNGFSLTAGQNVRFVFPASVVTGRVYIRGVAGSGNRIQIIGGSIRNTVETASGTESACLIIQDVDVAYVEGVKCDKADTAGDGFAFRGLNGLGGTLYLQNCLSVGTNYRDVALGHSFSQHGDGLQITSQITALYVDKFTIYSYAQGFLTNSSLQNQFASGSTILNGAVLRRMNVHLYDRADNPIPETQAATGPRHCFYMQDDCSALPIPYTLDAYTVENCYAVDDDPSGDSLLELVAPGSHNAASCSGTLDETTASSVYWSSDREIRGRVYYGVPPDGDYVASTFTGLSYTTPGYATVPGDTPPDTANFNYGAVTLSYDHTPTVKEVLDDVAESQGWAVPDPTNPDWFKDFPHTANPPHGVGYGDRWYDYPDQLVDVNAIPRFLWWNDRGFLPVTITTSYIPQAYTQFVFASARGAVTANLLVTRAASTPVTHTRSAPVSARGVPNVTLTYVRAATRTLLSFHVPTVGVATQSLAAAGTTQFLVSATGRGSASVARQKIAAGSEAGSTSYGTFAGSSLQALVVGSASRQRVAFRFVPRITGLINRVTFYNKYTSAVGTGGNIRISIYSNDVNNGNVPLTQLATTTITGAAQSPYNQNFLKITLDSSASVVAGTPYHVVFENLHADEASNYTYLNLLYYDKETPPHPHLPVANAAVLAGSDLSAFSAMTVQTGYQAIFNVWFTDDTAEGNPYTDVYVWLGSAAGFNGIISGTQQVRQTFTPSETIQANTIGLRYGKFSGSDDLSCRIETSGGTEIETVTFTAGESAVENDSSAYGTESHRWVQKTLAATRTFTADSGYRIKLSTPSTSQYRVYPLLDGTAEVPLQITGLQGWFHPTSGFSTSGSLITQWNDASGLGNHVTQSTGSAQPTKTAAGLNGYDIVTFANAQYLLGSGPATNPSAIVTSDGPLSSAFVFRLSNVSSHATIWSVGSLSSSDNHERFWFLSSSNLWRYTREGGDGVNVHAASSTASGVTGTWYVGIAVNSGTTVDVWLNGTKVIDTGALNASDFDVSITNFAIGVAKRSDTFDFMQGDIAEVIMYAQKALSAAEVSSLGNYLSAKYNIGGSW